MELLDKDAAPTKDRERRRSISIASRDKRNDGPLLIRSDAQKRGHGLLRLGESERATSRSDAKLRRHGRLCILPRRFLVSSFCSMLSNLLESVHHFLVPGFYAISCPSTTKIAFSITRFADWVQSPRGRVMEAEGGKQWRTTSSSLAQDQVASQRLGHCAHISIPTIVLLSSIGTTNSALE